MARTSPSKPQQNARRAQASQALAHAVRENSTATVLFHTAIAGRVGLSASDMKTLELLARLGPLTAGQLCERTGLASASVTALIDRLEAKGFVRRGRDPGDRRRVIVEPVPEGLARIDAAFKGLSPSLGEKLAGYTTEQLELLVDFLTEATRYVHAEIARMNDEESAGEGAGTTTA